MTQAEVEDARRADQLAIAKLRESGRDVAERIAALPALTDIAAGLRLIDSLEELWRACVGEGGEALQHLRLIEIMQRELVAAISAAVSDKPDVHEQFARSQQMRLTLRARFANPIVLELKRVPPEDLVYSVVAESPDAIALFLGALDTAPEAQAVLREHGARIIRDAMRAGYPRDEALAKAQALDVAL